MLRKLLTDRCPNVEILYKTSVTSMELDKNKRVIAVNTRSGSESKRVPCALLLDATGPAIASELISARCPGSKLSIIRSQVARESRMADSKQDYIRSKSCL